MAHFEVLKGVDLGRRFLMKTGVWVIGRDPGDAFQLHDPRVSRHHCRVTRTAEGEPFVLENQPSGSETMAAGRRVTTATPLHDGDQLLIGDTLLVFRASDPGDGVRGDQKPKDVNQRGRGTLTL